MHIFEGTELYPEIPRIVKEVAVKKGEYQSRYDEITELYEDIEDADIDKELTADLVGDYLFSDEDFVRRLSTENRSAFDKLRDEIKYLCKVATAGSEEARKLEQAKKLFEKVYREAEAKINTADEGGVRFSLTEMGFDEFSKETANNIKMRNGILIDSISDLEIQIEKALKRENKSNLYIGAISDDVKGKIENDIGSKIFKEKQYSFVVSYDDIVHISEHFGEDIQKLSDEVIKLYDIIKNYDTVKLDISDKGVKKLVFDKSYSDYDYRTVEIASNKKATLDLVTLFVTKNNIKKRNQSVPPAAKNGSQWGSVSNNSIPNSIENVKQNSKKSLSSPNTVPKKYGDYAVYGEDVMLEGEVKPTDKAEITVPTRESIFFTEIFVQHSSLIPLYSHLFRPFLLFKARQHKVVSHENGSFNEHSVSS